MTESDSYSPEPNNDGRCWNIGNIGDFAPSLVDGDTPESGISLHYGTTPCCSGNLTAVNVSVLLQPGHCQDSSLGTTSTVTAGNVGILTDCSILPSSLQIQVESSILCERNVEWLLSATNTTVYCYENSINRLYCKVNLIAQAHGRKDLSSSYYGKRFKLWRKYFNGSEVNVSVDCTIEFPNSCSFILDSEHICRLSVLYSYPSASSEFLTINGTTSLVLSHCRGSKEVQRWIPVVGGILGGVLLVVLGIAIILVKKRVVLRWRYSRIQDVTNSHVQSDIADTDGSSPRTTARAEIPDDSSTQRKGMFSVLHYFQTCPSVID